MKISFRKYQESDFTKIRDFTISIYKKLDKPNNWLIDRWEFVYYFLEKRNEADFQKWLDEIGIWEDENGEFVAVACTDQNIYFLLDTMEPSDSLMAELFNYAEKKLLKFSNGVSDNCLGITEGMTVMENFAISRGYKKQEYADVFISIDVNQEFIVNIPSKYKLKCGTEVDDSKKGLGHVMAFNYPNTEKAELTIKHYGNIKNAPDYNPELDLFIVNEFDEVISFCNIWVDNVNKIAILEPVGTHKDYRFQGLGKAVIYEGLNRVKNLGIKKVFVGATQPFYEKIGFKKELRLNTWRKFN